jgi:hypothetical protein
VQVISTGLTREPDETVAIVGLLDIDRYVSRCGMAVAGAHHCGLRVARERSY